MAWPHTGSRAATISNHLYGHIKSPAVTVTANRSYLVGAWLHGEVDGEDSFKGWYLGLEFFNGQGQSLGWQEAVSGRWVNPDWTYVEGRVTAPAGATTARVKLYNHLSSGWVTFDDVSLRACGVGGGGGGQGAPQPPPPEEQVLDEQPQTRPDYSLACKNVDACQAVGWPMPPQEAMLVHWAPMTELDEAIVREMMKGQPEGEGELPAGAPESGTVIVKRYIFNGQVVAMRRGGTLYFLRPDHLGSASLVLDQNGKWLADQRFYPYGERKRSDGASASYPTDRLFTGMAFHGTIGLYRMGARWYDPALSRWLSADTLVPGEGEPQALNRYSYVTNRPLNHTDPSGHMPCGRACPGDQITWGIDSEYGGSWDPRQQARNRATAKQVTGLMLDLGPSVGDVKGLVEVGTGRDLVTGEDLGNWRWTGLFGLVGLAEIRHLRYADEAMPGVRALGKIAEGLGDIFHDIRPFKNFPSPRTPSGWHAHHLVEKRFWRQLGFQSYEQGYDEILAVMVPGDFHFDEITSQLRQLIPNTGAATLQDIWNAHKQVYLQYEWGEDWLKAIWNAYFADKGMIW